MEGWRAGANARSPPEPASCSLTMCSSWRSIQHTPDAPTLGISCASRSAAASAPPCACPARSRVPSPATSFESSARPGARSRASAGARNDRPADASAQTIQAYQTKIILIYSYIYFVTARTLLNKHNTVNVEYFVLKAEDIKFVFKILK